MSRLSRILISSVLFPLVLSLTSQAQTQATHAARAVTGNKMQFLTVNDPVYNVDVGKLAFFAGWQGTAGMQRDDAFCPQCNSIALHMTSPDHLAQIQTFSQALHTGATQYPGQGQKGHFVRTRFTTTADLITRYILPAIDVKGQTSEPRPVLQRQGEMAIEEINRFGVGGQPFAQGAEVTVTGTGSDKDYAIEALTTGGLAGTPGEFTTTFFTVIEAPSGQADNLARAWEALPPLAINPAWKQINDDHIMAKIKKMQEQGQQQNAQIQQFIRDYNARQAAFNQSQLSSNAAARQAQQQRANQSQLDAQQNQRNITDTGNQIIDSRNGNGRYYTFCNSQTGQVVYQYNNTVPPDPSGHWLRCGN